MIPRPVPIVALLGIILAAIGPATAAPPTPPTQPAHGPGGADYPHLEVVAREGAPGGRGYWLFAPAEPRPAHAPVVVFCHGWGALDPDHYRAWIDHIVRRGNLVVWPNYQDNLLTRGNEFLPNAIAGIRAAFADLTRGAAGIQPDFSHVAIVGHSAGGVLAAQIAAEAARQGLPQFRAVMPVEPGDGSQDGRRRIHVPHGDLTAMPADTRLLIVVGEEDHRAYQSLGLRFYDTAVRVPPNHKNVIELVSDDHGDPPLLANHAAPSASRDRNPSRPRLAGFAEFAHAGLVDALDWYGTWKLFDALEDCAFSHRECEIALGGGPAQTYMGTWSDGVPVKPMGILR
jgi:acetyl esterase/lipase